MSLLERISHHKQLEVASRKKFLPLDSFQKNLSKSNKDFKQSLLIKKSLPCLIAEIKKASPIAGILRKHFNPLEICKIYEKYADAISVITDEYFFQGKREYLQEVSSNTSLPVLCKDFIIDEYQIYEARKYGADAILLIASLLNQKKINHFLKITDTLGMDALVEIHSEDELQMVLKTNAEIIGINNRNLKDFSISIDTTFKLASQIPPNKIIVSESGIQSKEDLVKIKKHINAVLIGTYFIKNANIEKAIQTLF